jgi:hypothetical protein
VATQTLVIAAGLLPLAAMLISLFAALWIRDAQREGEAVASHSQSR